MANVLPRDRQIAVIAALSEGISIRSVERLPAASADADSTNGPRSEELTFMRLNGWTFEPMSG